MNEKNDFDLNHKFLIALPGMGDKRFIRSVIFICHYHKSGSMGFVINKPKTDIKLSDMLPQIGLEGKIRVADTNVLEGGPVDIDRGFVLHSNDIKLKHKSTPLKHDLRLSSTRDALESLTSDKPPSKAIFAIGYTGWDGGQLEREIQRNVWMVAESDPDIIFSSQHEDKWERAIRSLGIEPHMLSSFGGQA